MSVKLVDHFRSMELDWNYGCLKESGVRTSGNAREHGGLVLL